MGAGRDKAGRTHGRIASARVQKGGLDTDIPELNR